MKQEKNKNLKQGFTLLELLVVVLIIGILAGIALPQYKLAVAKSRFSVFMNYVASLSGAQSQYYLVHGKYAEDIKDLDVTFPIEQCTKYNVGIRITYDCTNYMINMANNFDCLQAGINSEIIYTLILKDTTISNINMYEGERYCFAHKDKPIAQKVCQSYGNKVSSEGVWNHYLMD